MKSIFHGQHDRIMVRDVFYAIVFACQYLVSYRLDIAVVDVVKAC